MSDIKNSALLDKLLTNAKELSAANQCSAITIDHLLVAAIRMYDDLAAANAPAEARDEYAKTLEILAAYTRDEDALRSILDKWQGKNVPPMDQMKLFTLQNSARAEAEHQNRSLLTADIYLQVLARLETDEMKALHTGAGQKPLGAGGGTGAGQKPSGAGGGTGTASGTGATAGQPQTVADAAAAAMAQIAAARAAAQGAAASQSSAGQASQAASAPAKEGGALSQANTLEELVANTNELHAKLRESVMGQAHAVSTFVSGYFQAELQAMIEKDRRRPRGTFLFAGPPGVGKTFLSEETARILGLSFRRYDMSEYSVPSAVDQLAGSDANYKNPAEGLLTGFVAKNPRCILLLDEIEKASIDVIHLFLQVLDAGQLRDNKTDREVSFKDAILIFTTNAGKALYDVDRSENLAALSRDVILDALSKDINPKTGEPFFPAAICSRFASGNVLMFNHLDAYSLQMIIENQLAKHMNDMKDAMHIGLEADDKISTALLLAEGAAADGRTVKSRADAFFGGELYELFRLTNSESNSLRTQDIRNVRFEVNLEGAAEEVQSLFIPRERVHVLAYTRRKLPVDESRPDAPVMHYVTSADEAEALFDKEKIYMALCDMDGETEGETRWLNREDIRTQARSFLFDLLKKHADTPCVVLDTLSPSYSPEERVSFLRRGVRGFISSDTEDFAKELDKYVYSVFRQRCLTELSRSNQLMRYETAQRVDESGSTAYIVMFDMKLEQAVKAEDAENILSMVSRPKVHFADVYGADDAKKELQFFVNFIREPEKMNRQGVEAPKGLLLYGPPGTGKTMLAKAFANESGATFIAMEGNKFFSKWIGDSPQMVHKLFATARRYAPTVLFIDEIDVIGRARTGGDSASDHVQEEILTALFAEMDGFATDKKKPVFVLGATNYSPDPGARMRLDEALMRRFDRRILVDLPNLEARTKYLKDQMAAQPIFSGVTESMITSLANRTAGMSLANLKSVLDLAVRSAVRDGKNEINDEDLDEAFGLFNSGDKRTPDKESMLRTARHESGHTLISWLGGEKPTYVTIVSRGDYGGYMQYADQEGKGTRTRKELLTRIRTALGGRAAEIVYYGRDDGISTGASADLRNATNIARHILCTLGMDDEFGLAVIDPSPISNDPQITAAINGILKDQLLQAIALIEKNRDKVDRMVDRLMEVNSLNAQDIDNILQS